MIKYDDSELEDVPSGFSGKFLDSPIVRWSSKYTLSYNSIVEAAEVVVITVIRIICLVNKWAENPRIVKRRNICTIKV